MDDAHGFHCSNMQLAMEQYQMVVCKFIAAVQYMHMFRQLRRGFCTIVLHSERSEVLYSDSIEVCMASLRVSKTSFLVGTRTLALSPGASVYVDYKSTV